MQQNRVMTKEDEAHVARLLESCMTTPVSNAVRPSVNPMDNSRKRPKGMSLYDALREGDLYEKDRDRSSLIDVSNTNLPSSC